MLSRKQQAAPRTPAGFTLCEMAIAVLLLSVMAAVVLPRWTLALQKQRVSQAAGRVVADLTRAQAAAYGTSTSKTVTFTVGTSQYTIAGLAPLDRTSGTYVVSLAELPYQSTLVSVWGLTGTQTITFNGYGLPDKGGQIIVASGGIQKTIVVDAASGAALIL